MKTKSQLSRKVQLAFVSAVLALVAMAAVSYRGMSVSAESDRWVQHTHQVVENLEELNSAMRSAELDARLPLSTMAVNISAMEFRDEHFLDGVFSILEETGLDPTFLELELTESVLMKRAETTSVVLKKLRAKGIQLAVDDFGTGYSSLSYLRKFPIDALKIDQSFIRQITTAPDETTIVTAVISMGRSLKLRVVAEGVETQEELAFLQAHKCDEAQGFYFSRPVVPEQFARLLKTGIQEPSVIVHR